MADPNAAAPELKRIRWLVRAAFLWALIIFGRLAWLQTYRHEKLQVKADKQQEEDLELQPPRGTVQTRDGVFLAVSVPAWSVILNPRRLPKAEEAEALQVLARTLHLAPAKLSADLARARKAKRGFFRVKSKADQSEYQALRAWVDARNKRTASLKDNIEWVSFQQESRRVYPNGELAAPLIGAVDASETGYLGIEASLQKDLQGKPGWVRMLKDSQDHYVDALERHQPTPGKNVTLTIDSHLQFFCDRELARAVREKGFASGSIVAMNPNTGEVYAMSAYPTFDPSVLPKSEAELWSRLHRAVAQSLDPGSVMKMFTIAAALEHTRLRPSSLIDCGAGEFRFSSRAKPIGDTHAYGLLPLEKVLWFSSNVGAIRVGIEVGRQRLYQSLHDVGFGQKTGIALPGESAGVLHPLDKWQPSSLYFVSIGHEISVTSIQLAQAAAVFANGGFRVRPKLVLSKQAQNGEKEVEPESPRERVLRAETAIDMRKMSEGVVLAGTGKKAKIVGRTVGGKTGTAQMIDKTGHYVKVYSSSFMGYAPLNSPKIVVVVTLNGGKSFGGDSAAPVFSQVAAEALNMLGEPADVPVAESEQLPKLASATLPPAALARLEDLPVPPAPRDDEVVTSAAVPDFSGMDKRAVAQLSAERGLIVEMSGAGLARAQSPPPGSPLAMGSAVHVRFAR